MHTLSGDDVDICEMVRARGSWGQVLLYFAANSATVLKRPSSAGVVTACRGSAVGRTAVAGVRRQLFGVAATTHQADSWHEAHLPRLYQPVEVVTVESQHRCRPEADDQDGAPAGEVTQGLVRAAEVYTRLGAGQQPRLDDADAGGSGAGSGGDGATGTVALVRETRGRGGVDVSAALRGRPFLPGPKPERRMRSDATLRVRSSIPYCVTP